VSRRRASSDGRRRLRHGDGGRLDRRRSTLGLERLVDSAARQLRHSRDIWTTLADSICTREIRAGSDEMCWNGLDASKSVITTQFFVCFFLLKVSSLH